MLAGNGKGICDVAAIAFRHPQILDAANLINKC